MSFQAALIGGMFASITWQVGREVLTWWLAESGGATAGTVVGIFSANLLRMADFVTMRTTDCRYDQVRSKK